MDLQKISAIIIVKNAQNTLDACLNSLKEFGQIVLLDNESTDKTLTIAKDFQKTFPALRIESSPFIGFGALKNKALSYASHAWIFSIDADEVLEFSALRELENLEPQPHWVLYLPRKNLYRGEWIKACGWHPDFVGRVFNKNFTKFNDNLVHESLILPPGAQKIHLRSALRHHAYEGIDGLLEKCQRYSELYARQNPAKKGSMLRAIGGGGFKFMRDYFFKRGVFYGYRGFVIAFCNALGAFFKYAKLYELRQNFKEKSPSASLIITTYNSPAYLKAVLESVSRLESLPLEVLIADDGSGAETAALIEKFQRSFPCPLKHIWQEDKGFRAAKSRNNAVKEARGTYIILIDGDMVLEPLFIKEHLKFARRGLLLQGSRVLLNEAKTQTLFAGKGSEKILRAKKLPLLSRLVYNLSAKRADFFEKKDFIKGVRSCNMGFFKEDFDAVGGFNENFEGWGREDSEFVARFLFNGGEFRRLKFSALAWHLHHEENDRAALPCNDELYLRTLKEKKISWR